ncbi:14009_t:CDS:2, partial [Funneliformis mosseae]
DGITVRVRIIQSTLKPGESYYFSIDDDFVKDRINQTSLDGVKEAVFILKQDKFD